jgi:signal transduction histidine kinase
VSEHGGSISVQSAPGKGTTIAIRLPLGGRSSRPTPSSAYTARA